MSGRSWLQRFLGSDLGEARSLLRDALAEEHTSREVAESFGLGVFITMLPTLGTGFLAFVLLAAVVDRLSKLALLASAVVFNPVVKWGVYGASFGLGTLLLGPVEGVTVRTLSLAAAPEILVRLLLGNTVLAVVAAVPSYVLAYRLVERYGDDGRVTGVLDRVGVDIETDESGEERVETSE